jgi:hypothetical protein
MMSLEQNLSIYWDRQVVKSSRVKSALLFANKKLKHCDRSSNLRKREKVKN